MTLEGAGLAIGPAAPWEGFAYHKATLRNLSRQPDSMMEQTGQAFMGLKTLFMGLVSLANVVLDYCLALDYHLAEQGGVCVITNTSAVPGPMQQDRQKLMRRRYAPRWSGFTVLSEATSSPLSGTQLRKSSPK